MDQNNVQLQIAETTTLSVEKESSQLFGFVFEKTPKYVNHYSHINSLHLKQARQFIAGWFAIIFTNFDYFLGCFILLELEYEFQVAWKYLAINVTLASILRLFGAVIFRHFSHDISNRFLISITIIILAILYTITYNIGTFYGYSIVRGFVALFCGGLAEMGTLLIAQDLEDYNTYIYSSFAGLAGAISYMLVPLYLWLFQAGDDWRYLFLIGIIIILGVGFIMLFSIDAELDKESFKHRFRELGNGKSLSRSFGALMYTIIVTFAWNVIARGTQDIYPTNIRLAPGFTFDYAMLASFLTGAGALVGGVTIGIVTPFMGPQRSLLFALAFFFISYMIVNYAPASPRMTSGTVFFVQLFIQVAFSILPYHITKCFHPEDRAIIPIFGSMVGIFMAAFSVQTEASIGEIMPQPNGYPSLGNVQFYLMMVASAILLLASIFGGLFVYPDASYISADTHTPMQNGNPDRPQSQSKIQEP
jgi:SHS family lactate transporter-like MFS transporter